MKIEEEHTVIKSCCQLCFALNEGVDNFIILYTIYCSSYFTLFPYDKILILKLISKWHFISFSFSQVFEFFQLLPAALQVAFEEDLEFRQGLPLNYLDFMGVANSEKASDNTVADCIIWCNITYYVILKLTNKCS